MSERTLSQHGKNNAMGLRTPASPVVDDWLTNTLGYPCFSLRIASEGIVDYESIGREAGVRFLITSEISHDQGIASLSILPGETREMASRTLLKRPVQGEGDHDLLPTLESFRPSKSEVDEIADIASNAFAHSRFAEDPRIGDEAAKRVKRRWARNLATGARGEWFAAIRAGERMAGFIGVVRQEGVTDKEPKLLIDLVAVAKDLQGQGIGDQLLTWACDYADAQQLELWTSTQSTNRAALGMYANRGFEFHQQTRVFHTMPRDIV